jgi:hypothetical protein
MGLLGCPASFQGLAELTMAGLVNVIVYINDLLVHSKTHEEHLMQFLSSLLSIFPMHYYSLFFIMGSC